MGKLPFSINNFQTPMPIMFILGIHIPHIMFMMSTNLLSRSRSFWTYVKEIVHQVKVFGQVTIFINNFQTPKPIMFILGIHIPHIMLMMSTNLWSRSRSMWTYVKEIVHCLSFWASYHLHLLLSNAFDYYFLMSNLNLLWV